MSHTVPLPIVDQLRRQAQALEISVAADLMYAAADILEKQNVILMDVYSAIGNKPAAGIAYSNEFKIKMFDAAQDALYRQR